MVMLGLSIIPTLYFTNTWSTAYLPINSNHIFDNSGVRYNVSRILNSDFTINVAAYEVRKSFPARHQTDRECAILSSTEY